MSSVKTHEQRLFIPAEQYLKRLSEDGDTGVFSRRIEVLEAIASVLGGFNLEGYRELVPASRSLNTGVALTYGTQLLEIIQRSVPVHPSLALTSLSRPPLTLSEQRSAGSYYTDYRLAHFLAKQVQGSVEQSVVDLAAGTGVLLVALGLRLASDDTEARRQYVAHSVYAADLSPDAIRGTTLALASLTSDLNAIRSMITRLYCTDSLLMGNDGWRQHVPDGFQVVIGNPPWEKLKVSRHEFLLASGVGRHYGDEYPDQDEALLVRARGTMGDYVRSLKARYSLQGDTEVDLYKAFLELGLQLAHPDGQLAFLVPAGLIRAQGTEALRHHLFDRGTVELTVLDNKARFFAIDTRFKFVALHTRLNEGNQAVSLTLHHAEGNESGIEVRDSVHLRLDDLRITRPDLSPPEVRSDREWAAFVQMYRSAPRFDDPASGWKARIVREVDMTNDGENFRASAGTNRIPVIEGRMVQQHQFGAKAYICGTGRSALWRPLSIGDSRLEPQFWISPLLLRSTISARISQPRIGFCDIAGQTNERAMMAARIPAGVVCGNKVPTVTFEDEPGEANTPDTRPDLFLGVMNSLPFDWLLRRVLTTTINFFILWSLPVPQPEGAAAVLVADLVRRLDGEENPWTRGLIRAQIDVQVASLYGLNFGDLFWMFDDFPLLDRGQPALSGELRSTVTRDLILSAAARHWSLPYEEHEERCEWARQLGAYPYVPAEHAGTYAVTLEETRYA